MAGEQAAAAAAFQVALQTATKAAEAATAALAEIKRSQGAGLANRPQELELTGRPEEDRRLWSDWRFAATQYLMAKDVKFQESLQVVLGSASPLVMSALDQEEQTRSRQLFSFLAGSVKGRLLALLREDAVARARLRGDPKDPMADVEPTSGAAAIGLLETILNIPAPPKGTALRDAIIGMERLFVDYEATSGAKLSEHLKIATLRRLLPAELRVHVNLLVKDDSNYESVKKAVSESEVADRRFEPLRAEAVYDHGGVAPMEVDQVKGFGGKGKGKDKPKCPICGKNHAGKCWSKGKDGKGKSKGKAGHDHKGGKGKDDQRPKCQICDKTGHSADKCFQRYKDKDKISHEASCRDLD